MKIKGVRSLFQDTKSTDLVTRGEATNIIFKNDFAKHKSLFIEPRSGKDLTADQVFEFLLKHEFLRAGLELQCDNCKLWNWLSLKQLDDHWDCEYCGARGITSTQLKNRGDWKFRKSGLFAKDNSQEGAIPVILTLLTINRVFSPSQLIYSTSLQLNASGINCETDLVLLNYQSHNLETIEMIVA